jgi:hypothetical protein
MKKINEIWNKKISDNEIEQIVKLVNSGQKFGEDGVNLDEYPKRIKTSSHDINEDINPELVKLENLIKQLKINKNILLENIINEQIKLTEADRHKYSLEILEIDRQLFFAEEKLDKIIRSN